MIEGFSLAGDNQFTAFNRLSKFISINNTLRLVFGVNSGIFNIRGLFS